MTDRIVLLPLADLEGRHLADLVDQFIELLSSSVVPDDPGIRRLTPQAYPDDPDADAEFAAGTRADLLDRRIADARVVRAALSRFVPDAADGRAADGTGDELDDDALAPRDVVIARADLDAWLRTLTALRLVIASRLGIADEDDDHDPDDPRFGVYDWLGYRLDGLTGIADAEDADAEDADAAAADAADDDGEADGIR